MANGKKHNFYPIPRLWLSEGQAQIRLSDKIRITQKLIVSDDPAPTVFPEDYKGNKPIRLISTGLTPEELKKRRLYIVPVKYLQIEIDGKEKQIRHYIRTTKRQQFTQGFLPPATLAEKLEKVLTDENITLDLPYAIDDLAYDASLIARRIYSYLPGAKKAAQNEHYRLLITDIKDNFHSKMIKKRYDVKASENKPVTVFGADPKTTTSKTPIGAEKSDSWQNNQSVKPDQNAGAAVKPHLLKQSL